LINIILKYYLLTIGLTEPNLYLAEKLADMINNEQKKYLTIEQIGKIKQDYHYVIGGSYRFNEKSDEKLKVLDIISKPSSEQNNEYFAYIRFENNDILPIYLFMPLNCIPYDFDSYINFRIE